MKFAAAAIGFDLAKTLELTDCRGRRAPQNAGL